ncbi:hypothetical protein T492DRAFT_841434 [Pavlovales sp. CCMP2436]|nr:hypothetical protein T492DRAFT_841434 [Pavlovales sp. CCMP2436]
MCLEYFRYGEGGVGGSPRGLSFILLSVLLLHDSNMRGSNNGQPIEEKEKARNSTLDTPLQQQIRRSKSGSHRSYKPGQAGQQSSGPHFTSDSANGPRSSDGPGQPMAGERGREGAARAAPEFAPASAQLLALARPPLSRAAKAVAVLRSSAQATPKGSKEAASAWALLQLDPDSALTRATVSLQLAPACARTRSPSTPTPTQPPNIYI